MAAAPEPEITLYDIDPVFQNRLLAYLGAGKGHTVDIGLDPSGKSFVITSSDGSEAHDPDFEAALVGLMGSRAQKRRIDPEFGTRAKSYLKAHGAHITFQAHGDGFEVMVSNQHAKGEGTDEDFEVALVFAEEAFEEATPQSPRRRRRGEPAPLTPAQAEELRQALVPAEQRREEREQAIEAADVAARKVQWAQMERLGGMSPNIHPMHRISCDCEHGVCEQTGVHRAALCPGQATHRDTVYGLRLCSECAKRYDRVEELRPNIHPMHRISHAQRPGYMQSREGAGADLYPAWTAGYSNEDFDRTQQLARERGIDHETAALIVRGANRYAGEAERAVGIKAQRELAGLHRNPAGRSPARYAAWVSEVGDIANAENPDMFNESSLAYVNPRFWRRSFSAGLTPRVAVDEAGSEASVGLERNSRPYETVPRDWRTGPGAWRVQVGTDVDPQNFKNREAAAEHARAKYGETGWTIEWFALSDETSGEPVGRGSLMRMYGYTPPR
jgi:hypothetical protein